jgi:hypothetical protein
MEFIIINLIVTKASLKEERSAGSEDAAGSAIPEADADSSGERSKRAMEVTFFS